ncbi:MAG: alpha/beta hydrolase, partial [Proteobacteria bacterium]|nr:alpha/beta hydrolase [Pseudomonadota bacterium]
MHGYPPRSTGRSTGKDLPNSNQPTEVEIYPSDPPDLQDPAIRRAIPPQAREGRWLAADGRAIRRIDWAVPPAPRGALLFLPGRGDCYEKYLEALDHWHRLGWAVTALDWRGQAGSGREGADPLTGHIADFAVWVADLARFWREWAATVPGPRVLAGHSMGGHLVLRALAE